ncbi:MAG: hypothetical protein WCX08_05110 [Candidatus Buchananbacteria bacterium]
MLKTKWFMAGICLIVGMALGCPSSFPRTGIVPEIGNYSFSQDGNFAVWQDGEAGQIYLRFSSDGYRWDNIPVIAGTFYRQWGEIGGTHCPSDAYILSGHFTSPTHAEGHIQYGYNCVYTWVYPFEADFVP